VIRGIRYQLALRRLQAKKRDLQSDYRRELWDATTKGPAAGWVKQAMNEGELELRLVNEEIRGLITARLLEQAQRYEIFWPEEPVDDEERLQVGMGLRTFSPETIEKLRSEIRKERKERWDRLQAPITLMIGLMGALIGVLSLLLK
jgi:hypothetical protein